MSMNSDGYTIAVGTASQAKKGGKILVYDLRNLENGPLTTL